MTYVCFIFYFIKFLFIVDGFILPCDNLRDTEKVLFHIIKNMRLTDFPSHTKEQWLSVYEIIDQFYSYFLTLGRRIFLYFCLFLASLWNGITLFPWFPQLSFVYDDIKTQSLYSSDLSPTFTFMWSQFSPRASPYLVNISTWSSL